VISGRRDAGLNVALEIEEGRKLLAGLKPRIQAHVELIEDACRTIGASKACYRRNWPPQPERAINPTLLAA
jgi:hypothetical protein